MKHIFYHLTAVMVVVVWGMTFISTKVLIVHGLSAQEIFLFRFLLAYAAVCPISFHRFFARNLKDELYLVYNPQNEMFATFQTKRYFIQNETSSKK